MFKHEILRSRDIDNRIRDKLKLISVISILRDETVLQ